jgi:hypothetical protein
MVTPERGWLVTQAIACGIAGFVVGYGRGKFNWEL